MKTTEIIVKGNKILPTITYSNGRISIKGRSISLTQNEWLDLLIQSMNIRQISFDQIQEISIELDLVNSETNRTLLNLFSIAEKLYNEGNEIKIYWKINKNDLSMIDNAYIFKSIFEMPIEIEYKLE